MDKFLMRTLIIAAGLAFGSIPAFGQKHLDEFLNRCENLPDASITVISRKDPDTRETTQNLKTLTVSTKALVDQLREAAVKDKDDAIQVIEEIKGGKMIPSLYHFNVDGQTITYTFDLKDNKGTITRIFSPQGKRTASLGFSIDAGQITINPAALEEFRTQWKNNDWSRFSDFFKGGEFTVPFQWENFPDVRQWMQLPDGWEINENNKVEVSVRETA